MYSLDRDVRDDWGPGCKLSTCIGSLTTEDPHSLEEFDDDREFDSFAEPLRRTRRSRIWLGVHFQFDGTDRPAIGRAVADHVTETRLRPIQTCQGWNCAVAIPSS